MDIKEHPILFKSEMVRALLAGTKTQTRRTNLKTKYAVGDRLWVRETWTEWEGVTLYRASYGDIAPRWTSWSPSLFMPRERCRITLEVTAVREERLQDISDDDARQEGVAEYAKGLPDELTEDMSRVEGYRHLWESINGPGSWDANPVVRVISFKVVNL